MAYTKGRGVGTIHSGPAQETVRNRHDISHHVRKDVFRIPRSVMDDLLGFVNTRFLATYLDQEWKHVYPWYGLRKGIVSPIVRIDMSVPHILEQSLQLHTIGRSVAALFGAPAWRRLGIENIVYEIETNPEGWHAVRAAHLVHHRGDERYARVTRRVRQLMRALEVCGFCNLSTKVTSDERFADDLALSYTTTEPTDGIWWIRTDHITEQRLRDEQYANLSKRSVTDIYGDSRKDYLIPLKLARNLSVYLQEHNVLPTETGFCIKPIHGTRSSEVIVRPPRAVKAFDDTPPKQPWRYVIMPYIPQGCCFIDKTLYKVILRLYLIWDLKTAAYQYLTGITTAIPNSHGEVINGGRSDALFWLVDLRE